MPREFNSIHTVFLFWNPTYPFPGHDCMPGFFTFRFLGSFFLSLLVVFSIKLLVPASKVEQFLFLGGGKIILGAKSLYLSRYAKIAAATVYHCVWELVVSLFSLMWKNYSAFLFSSLCFFPPFLWGLLHVLIFVFLFISLLMTVAHLVLIVR